MSKFWLKAAYVLTGKEYYLTAIGYGGLREQNQAVEIIKQQQLRANGEALSKLANPRPSIK